MQNLLTLNELYAQYTDGLLKKKAFEGAIFRIIKKNMYQLGLAGWNREERDDFISSLYPRISRAVNKYQETGSSFEIYINTLVRLTAKEYCINAARSYVKETAAWITQIPDMYVCENETEYDDRFESETEDAEKPVKLKNPRQLLILILKCCNYVTADFLEKVSPQLGIKPETLSSMIDRLKKQQEKRITEFSLMRERVSNQLYRCIFYQKELEALTENNIVAQRLRKRLEHGRIRLKRMRRRMARARLDPSNLQIAKLLGLSKNTVDAVLHILRSRAASLEKTLQDEAGLNQSPDYQKNTE
jgi:DNA-binding MarR family transcriptional regulator